MTFFETEQQANTVESIPYKPKELLSHFDQKTALVEGLGLSEAESEKVSQYLKSGEWIDPNLFESVEVIEGHILTDEERLHSEKTKRFELPAIQCSFTLTGLLGRALTSENGPFKDEPPYMREARYKRAYRNFQETFGATDTEITASFYVPKEAVADLKKIEAVDEYDVVKKGQDHLRKIFKNGTYIVNVNHGWDGSGASIVNGEATLEGDRFEKMNMISAVYGDIHTAVEWSDGNEAAVRLRGKMWGFAYDRLGMGKMKLSESVTSYGPADDEKFAVFMNSLLGYFDKSESGPKTCVSVGHSMGGELAINIASHASRIDKGVDLVTFAANPAIKSADSARPDPNQWNTLASFWEAVQKPDSAFAALMVGGLANKMKNLTEMLRIRKVYDTLEKPIRDILLNIYLAQESRRRPDLKVAHRNNYASDTAHANFLTSLGNKNQKGIEDADIWMAQRHSRIVIASSEGDPMVNAKSLREVLPSDAASKDKKTAPIALHTSKKGGHYGYWDPEGQAERAFMTRAAIVFKDNEQFNLLSWAEYAVSTIKADTAQEAVNTFLSEKLSSNEFLDEVTGHPTKSNFASNLAKAFNLQKSDIETFLSGRADALKKAKSDIEIKTLQVITQKETGTTSEKINKALAKLKEADEMLVPTPQMVVKRALESGDGGIDITLKNKLILFEAWVESLEQMSKIATYNKRKNN